MSSLRTTRLTMAIEAVLLLVLSASWVVAIVAAERSLETVPPGSRSFILSLYETDDRFWLALLLGLAGIAALVARHRFPTGTFAAVTSVVLIIQTMYPYIARLQFATSIMLLTAGFWAMWKTTRFSTMVVVALLAAAMVTLPFYRVNQNLELADALALPGLTSLSAAAQSVILMAVGAAAAALVRRFDTQAAALAAQNLELEEQRAASSRAAVLDERVRISRELHDVVAHHVTSMTVHAGAARQIAAVNPEGASESLQQIEQSGRDAVSELQRLLGFLRGDGDTVESDDRSPAPSLRHLEHLTSSLGPGFSCEVAVQGELATVPQSVDVSAYRIVQEALTNVMKHSTARHADVGITAGPEQLELRIVDNGYTSDTSPDTGNGHGLVGMRERVALHGGTIEAGPVTTGGWLVEATLPYRGSPV